MYKLKKILSEYSTVNPVEIIATTKILYNLKEKKFNIEFKAEFLPNYLTEFFINNVYIC